MENYSSYISKLRSILQDGKIILYPTDTIYGIGCDATNSIVVDKILKLKTDLKKKV